MDRNRSFEAIPEISHPPTIGRDPAKHEAQIFQHLKDHPIIWVVGPQRAGTRIGARMIAADTGHKFIDEQAYSIDSLSNLHRLLTQDHARKVIQGPAITRWIHRLAQPGDMVVMMQRSLADIHASEARINWQYDWTEAMKYGASAGSAELKYRFWHKYQREAIDHNMDLAYSLLSAHPMWVDKASRADFKWNQTTIN